MINKLEKYLIYLGVEKEFYEYLRDCYSYKKFLHINTCCNSCEQKMLLELSEKIKEEYNNIYWKDIYIIIIFIYYALILAEQSTDLLDTSFLQEITLNYKKVLNIIIEISHSDKEYAKKIRRTMLQLE